MHDFRYMRWVSKWQIQFVLRCSMHSYFCVAGGFWPKIYSINLLNINFGYRLRHWSKLVLLLAIVINNIVFLGIFDRREVAIEARSSFDSRTNNRWKVWDGPLICFSCNSRMATEVSRSLDNFLNLREREGRDASLAFFGRGRYRQNVSACLLSIVLVKERCTIVTECCWR